MEVEGEPTIQQQKEEGQQKKLEVEEPPKAEQGQEGSEESENEEQEDVKEEGKNVGGETENKEKENEGEGEEKKKGKKKKNKRREEDAEKEKEKYDEAVKNSFLHGVESLLPEERQLFAEIENHPMKLICTNLPLKISVAEIQEYFNQAIISYDSSLAEPTPIKGIEIDRFRTFAVLELSQRRIKDYFTKHTDFVYSKANAVFKIMRPKVFFEERYGEKSKKQAQSGPGERLYIGGLPHYFTDDQVKKICETFGKLKYITIIKDNNVSKGYGFMEYEDAKSTDKAIQALNNLPIADRKLKCQKASIGGKTSSQNYVIGTDPATATGDSKKKPSNHNGSYLIAYKNIQDINVQKTLVNNPECKTHSRVVQFLNMFYIEDLFNQDSYENLKADLQEECSKYGPIDKIVIPRPDPVCGYSCPTVGKAFVKFMYIIAAKRARIAIAGKVYNKRTVVTSFYPEQKFNMREYLVAP